MRRREFIAGLGAAAAWPLTARAQQPAVPVVGFIHGGADTIGARYLAAFRAGLGETGYVEGQNIAVDERGRPLTPAGDPIVPPASGTLAWR